MSGAVLRNWHALAGTMIHLKFTGEESEHRPFNPVTQGCSEKRAFQTEQSSAEPTCFPSVPNFVTQHWEERPKAWARALQNWGACSYVGKCEVSILFNFLFWIWDSQGRKFRGTNYNVNAAVFIHWTDRLYQICKLAVVASRESEASIKIREKGWYTSLHGLQSPTSSHLIK